MHGDIGLPGPAFTKSHSAYPGLLCFRVAELYCAAEPIGNRVVQPCLGYWCGLGYIGLNPECSPPMKLTTSPSDDVLRKAPKVEPHRSGVVGKGLQSDGYMREEDWSDVPLRRNMVIEALATVATGSATTAKLSRELLHIESAALANGASIVLEGEHTLEPEQTLLVVSY